MAVVEAICMEQAAPVLSVVRQAPPVLARLPRDQAMKRGTFSSYKTTQWLETLDGLSAAYADFKKDDLTLAVAVALLARISEQTSVTVGLQIVRYSGVNTGLVPFTVTVDEKADFDDLLNQVVLKRIALEMRDAVSPMPRQTPDVFDLSVVFGRRKIEEPNADIQMIVGEDGAVEWCHDATIALDGIASLSARMISICEQFGKRPRHH